MGYFDGIVLCRAFWKKLIYEKYESQENEKQPPVINNIGGDGIRGVAHQFKEFDSASTGFDFEELHIYKIEQDYKRQTEGKKDSHT